MSKKTEAWPRTIRRWLMKFCAVWNRDQRKQEFGAEIESHLQYGIEENLKEGMNPQEARRQAILKLGGIDATKEAYGDQLGFPRLETCLQEVRFALRRLSKNPSFTVIASLTLALGLGVNLAVVTLANSLFFRPLPGLANPGALAILGSSYRGEGFGDVSYPEYRDIRGRTTVFADLAAVAPSPFSFTADGSTERLMGEFVSANYFKTLGVPFVAGRDFSPEEEDAARGATVAVISDRLWRQRWNGDSNVIGKTAVINNRSFTIIGIVGGHFRGCQLPGSHDLWVSLAARRELQQSANDYYNDRGFSWLQIMVGRLKPGVTLLQARANIDILAGQFRAEYPAIYKDRTYRTLAYTPFPSVDKTAPRIFMAVLIGVTLVILTVVAANIAALFMARTLARQREMAVHLALGSSRWRLIGRTLIESFLICAISLCLGLFIANYGANLLIHQIPGDQGEPIYLDLSPDRRIVFFAVALLVTATFVVGLSPAAQSSRIDVINALKAGDPSISPRRSPMRKVLVIVQISLCLLLLVGAGLLFQSLHLLAEIDIGVRAENLLLAEIDPSLNNYDRNQASLFYGQLVEAIGAQPGVEAVATARSGPLAGKGVDLIGVYGGRTTLEARLLSGVNPVSSDYFRATGIALLRGREFLATDGTAAQPVAIVNQTLAQKLWPDEDALGQFVRVAGDPTPKRVVGIVRDAIYRDLVEDSKRANPFCYFPISQSDVIAQVLHIRTKADPSTLVPTIRALISKLDAHVPLYHVTTLKNLRREALFPQRIATGLVTTSGILAIVLASVGLYAVMAQEVASRTREIGIRLALGAKAREILLLFLRDGMNLAGIGIVIGVAAAIALTKVLSNLLYGVSPLDFPTFLVIVSIITFMTLVACWLPSRRAGRIDPMSALRSE